MHAVVPVEVQAKEGWDRLAGSVGQIQQQVHPRSVRLAQQEDRHFLPRGLAAQSVGVERRNLEGDFRNRCRRPSVDVGLKQLQDFRSAFASPTVGVGDFRPVLHHERIGQRVGGHLGLVIDRVLGLPPGNSRHREGDGRRKPIDALHDSTPVDNLDPHPLTFVPYRRTSAAFSAG